MELSYIELEMVRLVHGEKNERRRTFTFIVRNRP